MVTLYDILGVKESSTQEEIKDAYRVMAMKWHPDRNLNNRLRAEEKFKEIGAAYKTLSDPSRRREYDQWLVSQRKQSSQKAYSNAAGMSGDDAEKIFFESMLDLATELASRGYDANAIAKVLIALECPEAVAKVVAKKAAETYRQEKTPPKAPHPANSMSDWDKWAPYFAAALVAPDYSPSDDDNFTIVKAVRTTLFIAASVIFFGMFFKLTSNAKADEIVGAVIISVLLGWGCMFSILQFSSTHRHFLCQERLHNYLKKYENIFKSKNRWQETSSAILFPPPWFGYYGLLWPLVAVAAIFFSVDFFLLINVHQDVLDQKILLSVWGIASKPWIYIVVWVALGYSFDWLLFTETKKRLAPFFNRNNLDKAAIYKVCQPKLWRAILVTVAFILLTITPQEFIFPVEAEQINAALQADNIPPQKLYDEAIAVLDGKSSAIAKNAIPIYLQVAAKKEHVGAQAALGWIYQDGKYVARNIDKSIYWYARAATGGDANSNLALGRYYFSGNDGLPKDESRAVFYWKIAAEKGNSDAQVGLGLAYMAGIGGLPKNYQQGVYWTDLAAKQGNADGLYQLGLAYENGDGVKQDFRIASELYREASKRGNKEAVERLSALLHARLPLKN